MILNLPIVVHVLTDSPACREQLRPDVQTLQDRSDAPAGWLETVSQTFDKHG